MHKLAGAILGALVLLTSCSTAPHRQSRPQPEPHEAVTVETNAPVREVAPELVAPTPAVAPPPTNLPTTVPPRVTTPAVPTWQSLNRWASARGLGPLRRVTTGPVESFALVANTGVLTLSMGSLAARWENLELRLGFAPQLADGQVLVHSLDLRKNIEPLLRPLVLPAAPERIIVIDPGHGGSNVGTRSVDGRFEKEFTLDWALRLAPLLQTNGWTVYLTRTNDVDVSLAERVEFAEQCEADLFVSLHFNSPGSGNRSAAGLETYCLTPKGMASTLTRDYDDDITQSFPNNAFDEQNLAYAVRLHSALLKLGGVADRAVRRARFQTVLRGHNRPAILIEGGFLSNPAEARRIADPAFRQKMAEALAEALR